MTVRDVKPPILYPTFWQFKNENNSLINCQSSEAWNSC